MSSKKISIFLFFVVIQLLISQSTLSLSDQLVNEILRKGCGNGLCGDLETPSNCPQDCAIPEPHCGDNKCNIQYETCNSCEYDCGPCPAEKELFNCDSATDIELINEALHYGCSISAECKEDGVCVPYADFPPSFGDCGSKMNAIQSQYPLTRQYIGECFKADDSSLPKGFLSTYARSLSIPRQYLNYTLFLIGGLTVALLYILGPKKFFGRIK